MDPPSHPDLDFRADSLGAIVAKQRWMIHTKARPEHVSSGMKKHKAAGEEAKFQVQLGSGGGEKGLKCQTSLLGRATIPNSASGESRDSYQSLKEKKNTPKQVVQVQ